MDIQEVLLSFTGQATVTGQFYRTDTTTTNNGRFISPKVTEGSATVQVLRSRGQRCEGQFADTELDTNLIVSVCLDSWGIGILCTLAGLSLIHI